MKNTLSFLAALLIMPTLVPATPEPDRDLSKIPEPPADAPTGKKHDGVQIGLWTEKLVYEGDEIRNVWTLAKSDRSSATTIGVGGTLYIDSFLHITRNGKPVSKVPLNGGIDGIVNPTGVSGGISSLIAKLPRGSYKLTWETQSHTSNTITIELR